MSEHDPSPPAESDIAVIGLAGRFPGSRDVASFWRNLREGVECISRFSPEELERAPDVPEDPWSHPHFVPAGGVLEGIELFDHDFFDISPRDAQWMDPQQRLFLQHAWTALEGAGYDPSRFKGKISLYAGAGPSGYLEAVLRSAPQDPATLFEIMGTAGAESLATKTSYKLGLRGESLMVYTACSTGLVAVHMACQSLLLHQSDIALAGAARIFVPHRTGYLYQEGMILSPDGHCRAFDHQAQGTVGGNGVAVVVLKRLVDALRDRDHIHAVLKGSAINNDGGMKSGYTAPTVYGQAAVIEEAQVYAGVEPADIGYVEAHGTGTPLGDPIEIAALTRAFGPEVERGSCAIGSVKTNIGHLDTVAGLAGFIKVVLALEEEALPPSLNFERPNPELQLERSPFFVNTTLRPWPRGELPRRAGVSSFGIGGTNAHAVLEEAPLVKSQSSARPWQLVTLSARTASALETMARELAASVEARPGMDLADLAFTRAVGRKTFEHRRALVVPDTAGLIERLRQPPSASRAGEGRASRAQRVAFLFPGQGAQSVAMGRELYPAEPEFRRHVDACLALLDGSVRAEVRALLLTEADAEQTAARLLSEPRCALPALFIVEYALVGLWKSWGIQPHALFGHSYGEYVAACVAGVLSLGDGLRLAVARGRLMSGMPLGAMLAVALPEEQVLALLSGGLCLAAVNGPQRCVVSGPVPEVERLAAELQGRGVGMLRLPAAHAFHSHAVEPLMPELARTVASLARHAPTLRYVSSRTGTWTRPEEAGDPRSWAEQMRQPVRFAAGLETLLREGCSVFIEVGPGQDLTGLARDFFSQEREVFAVPSLRRAGARASEHQVLLQSLGDVWRRGVDVDWTAFYAHERRKRLPLPTYPFEEKRCWIEPRARSSAPVSTPAVPSAPLLPAPVVPAPAAPAIGPVARGALPRGEIEQRIAALWSERLGTSGFGREDNFLELGGNSLMAAQLLTGLRETFGVQLPLGELFEEFTVAGIAARVEALAGTSHAVETGQALALVPVPHRGALPLSYTQERVWRLEQFQPGHSAYNIPLALRLEGALDVEVLERSVREVVHRHAALRTTYVSVEGQPRQHIAPSADVRLEVIEPAGTRAEREAEALRLARQDALRPFSLDTGPVLRVSLVRLAEAEHVLLVSIHHVVSDTLSMLAFIREVGILYEAFRRGHPSPLPPLPIQYADFAVWQRRSLTEGRLKEQQAYWRQQLAGMPKRLELSTEPPRPSGTRFSSVRHQVELTPQLAEALAGFCKREGVTTFMTVLAAWQALLARYSGQEDIVVGTPIANRSRGELEPLIGYVAHTVALRTNLSGDPSFRELLARVREMTLAAYAHPDVPYEQVAEELEPEKDLGRSRVLDSVFVLHAGGQEGGLELPGLRVSPFELPDPPVQWGATLSALSLLLGEGPGRLSGVLEYATELFDAHRIERLWGHFQTLLAAGVAEPESRLSSLPLMTREEKQALAPESAAFPTPSGLSARLMAWAASHPEQRALTQGEQHFTWRQLRTRAVGLAARLRTLGVGPEVPVALCLERSVDKVAALWGILAAGGACLPLGRAQLPELRRFAASGAREPVLVTTRERVASLSPPPERVLFMEDGVREPEALGEGIPGVEATTLACIAPAPGVPESPALMLTQGNLAWLFERLDALMCPREGQSWLAADEGREEQPELELLWALSRGLRVVLPPERLTARLVRLRGSGPPARSLDFSLSFFANDEDTLRGPKYELLLECAKFADAHGFSAIWTPERHFHPFGGIYPQPAVVGAALAALTRTLQIRAGSVVLPLHDPLEVAEQWSVVDNLSGGRVGVSFASGWHAHDFVLAPDRYEERKAIMLRELETVRALWRGGRVQRKGGGGLTVEVGLRPRPVQPELPVWLTAAANPETFRLAGEMGAGVLTNLMGHDLAELREKVALYREAWRRRGHGPGRGQVSLMMHTFVGPHQEEVLRTVRKPLLRYFRSSLDITTTLLASQGQQQKIQELTSADLDALVEHGFERYANVGGLIGTPELCEARLRQIQEVDVDDVACLIDFGLDLETTLEGLRHLDTVKQRMAQQVRAGQAEVLLEAGAGARELLSWVEGTEGAIVHGSSALARALTELPRAPEEPRAVRAFLLEGSTPVPRDVSRESLAGLDVFLQEGSGEEGGWPVARRWGEEPSGVTWHVLDTRGQAVPVGVVGELVAGGPGVARGFWNAPAQAQARFMPSPFQPAARLYRPVRQARLLPDGRVERLASRAPAMAPSKPAAAAPGLPPSVHRVSRDRPLPLSFAQQRLWYLDQLEPTSTAYNNPAALRLFGPLDIPALQAALDEMERRHEVLRTALVGAPGGPVQVISPPRGLPLSRLTVREDSDEGREAEVARLCEEEAGRPFELSRGPLMRPVLIRVREDEHVLLLLTHHAISDGWSSAVISEELTSLYAAFHEGRPSPLPELEIQYADYAVWQREWMTGPVLEDLLSWWRQRLAGVVPLELPLSHPRPAVQAHEGARHRLVIPKALSESLLALGRREGATPFMTVMALYQVLLSRYSGQEDFVVGSPTAGRSRPELERLVGVFINLLAFRAEVRAESSFRELLGRVRKSALEAYAHQEAPFERVVEALRLPRDLSRPPLIQTALTLHNTPGGEARFAGLRLREMELDPGTTMFELHMDVLETSDGLQCTLEYATALFAPGLIERMARHLVSLAVAAVAEPGKPVSRLSLLTDEELRQVLGEWNATGSRPEPVPCVQRRFEARVAAHPHLPAVRMGEHTWTAAEVNAEANRIAYHLRTLGVGPGARVALYLERSAWLVAGLLGILKAGGAFVPLDPRSPAERIHAMLRDSGAAVVLTQSRLAHQLEGLKLIQLCLDSERATLQAASAEDVPRTTSLDTPAYVIYTSGSTGQPKGVEVSHGSLSHYVHHLVEQLGLSEQDRLLQFSSMGFDAALEEIFGALLSGALLVLRPEELLSAGDFTRWIARERITVLDLPTAYWQTWVGALERGGTSVHEELRLCIIGGEKAARASLDAWRRVGTERVRWLNTYGPTETTIVCSAHDSHRERPLPPHGEVPIGRAFAHARLYVLDARGEPVPVGVPGELYVGGPGVALGYLGQPALTAERFVPDPFSAEPGARLYRTGDRCQWWEDGQLEYLGRQDEQVKIRGFRVEPGEIEVALKTHPAVREAVVVAHRLSPGDTRLVAHAVAHEASPPPSAEQLREHLRGRLPDYMLPSAIVWREALPLLPSGKIDRRALPAPESVPIPLGEPPLAPRDYLERTLVELWQEVLEVPSLGVREDFFALGGHSLLAMRLVARVEERLGRTLPLAVLLRGATVESLARSLREEAPARPWSPLVALQPLGQGQPFFCVHAGGGGVRRYAELARALGPTRPVYGLECLGLEASQEPDTSLAAMAARYVDAVRGLQPRGPYLLGGWSFGGLVAMEMASQLLRAGEQVGLLVLMDTMAPMASRPARALPEDRAQLLSMFATLHGVRVPAERLESVELEEQVRRVVEAFARQGLSPGAAQIHRLVHVYEAHMTAAWRHTFTPYPGPLTLLRASDVSASTDAEDSPQQALPDLGWGAWTSRPIEVHSVPGDHFSMLGESQVPRLAEHLRRQLQTADPD